MITTRELDAIRGAEVYGPGDEKIGSAVQVYLDDESGQPEWVTVKTGLFGMKESFIPLADARWIGDHLEVPYDKSRVKDAPRVEADTNIEPDEEQQLYAYYGMADSRYANMRTDRSDTMTAAAGANAGRAGDYDMRDKGRNSTDRMGDAGMDRRDDTGMDRRDDATMDGGDDAMTRSEERVQAGTRNEAVGKVRLRKYVVTEQQQVTVPVTHEEVRVEREPITDANRDRAMSGPEFTEQEHEVTLHAERAVVTTEAVPVERIRLGTETVTEQETVAADVRREQIEVERDGAAESVDDDLGRGTRNDRGARS